MTDLQTSSILSTVDKVKDAFVKTFNEKPIIISSPGRINLIGEHTDYNKGFVLPAAIDKRMFIAIARSKNTNQAKISSLDFNEEETFNLTSLADTSSGWRAYMQAMLQELSSRSYNACGFNCVLSSSIPLGSGMSSSAALCCGFLTALNTLFGWELPKLEIAKIAQASEHRLGVNVGLMDQFSVMFGKKNNVIKLDCRDYSYEYFPLDLKDLSLVLINTNVKHELVDSAYNDRRTSCERALDKLQQHNPAIKTLRDVSLKYLEFNRNVIEAEDFRRVSFVLCENERVKKTTCALAQGHIYQVGDLLYQSHQGLSEEYQVSCQELDLLVALSKSESAVLGARMMGGGFGGCTINLVKSADAISTVSRIMDRYKEQTQIQPESYLVSIDDGVSQVEL